MDSIIARDPIDEDALQALAQAWYLDLVKGVADIERGAHCPISQPMMHSATFYFANLGADIARCAAAAEQGDESRYGASLVRARQTLKALHATGRPEAYEEGLLMLRGLALARESPTALTRFRTALDALIGASFARMHVR
jgi:hypothetical protein